MSGTTTLETAMTALALTLAGTGAQVWRATDLARDVPPEGLIELREGEAHAEALLSPLAWEIDQHAEVIVTVTAADEPTRDAALDAMLRQIGALIVADRTLGGAIDWAEPLPPEYMPAEIDGAGKSARVTIVLSFFTQNTVLS